MKCHNFVLYVLILVLNFSIGFNTYAENEPNNNFEEANALNFLGFSYDGLITEEGDKDYLKFETGPGLIWLRSTILPENINSEMVLFDAEKNVIRRVSNNNYIEIKYYTCSGGTFYVLFHDKNDTRYDASSKYEYRGTLEKKDLYECNNSKQTASTIKLNEEVTAAVQNKGDLDYYKFQIPRAGVIDIKVNNIPSRLLPYFVLYTLGDSIVKKGNSGDASLGLRHYTCDANATYYLLFRDAENDAESFDQYSITITMDTTDIYECNNSLNVPALVPLDQEITAVIQSVNDRDFYAFDLKSNGLINISLKDISSNITPYLALYDVDKNNVVEKKGVKGDSEININHFTCKPGRYYFFFRDYGNVEWNSQPYRFMVKNVTVDAHECNDKIEEASSIGLNQKISGAIQSQGDLDYYSVNLGVGVMSLNLGNIPKEIRGKVQVLDKTGALMVSKLVDTLGTKDSVKQMICAEGIYYIVISDASGKGFSYANYELVVSSKKVDVNECNNTKETATKIKIGETLHGYIDNEGDDDFYAFENPGAGLVIAKVEGIAGTVQPYLEAFDKLGNSIRMISGNKGDNELILEFSTCEEEDYYLVFKDENGLGYNDVTPYTLFLSHEQLDQYECNNTKETAITITPSVVIRASIRPTGDLDFYKFSLMENTPYQLIVDLIPQTIDMLATVYKSGDDQPLFTRKINKDSIMENFTVPVTGEFILKLEDEEGNNASTSSYYLLIKEKPNNMNVPGGTRNTLKVYPNPASNYVRIEGLQTGDFVEVIDFTGKTILETIQNKMDVSQLRNGIYLIRSSKGSFKFVKN